MSGLVAAPLLRNDYATALKNAKTYVEIFGDRFYIEVMRHGMPEEDLINTGLVSVARELGVPIVATNDSHYLDRTDAPAHDVLLCIGTGKTVADASRMKFYSDAFYVKSADEMHEIWSDLPEACENTLKIADRVDIRIPEKIFHLPEYPVPQTAGAEKSDEEYLREICRRRLEQAIRRGARAHRSRVARTLRVRAQRDYEDGILVLLPHRVGFREVCARPRHTGRTGTRFRGRVAGRLLPGNYRPRSAALQSVLRAFPQSGSHLDARHRHGFLCRPARRSHRLRHRKVRQGSRRADRHVRHDGGACRDSRRRPGAGRAAARRRPRGETHSVGSGRPDDRQGLGAAQRVEVALLLAPRNSQTARYRQRNRRAGAQRRHARRRGRDFGGPAHGIHAAGSFQRRRHQHAVRHGVGRKNRPPQNGFPRFAQPDRDGQCGQGDPPHDRSGVRPVAPPVRRRQDLRDAGARRDDGHLSARVRRDAARLRGAAAVALRRHHRLGRALPSGPDGTRFRVTSQSSTDARSRITCMPSSSRFWPRPTASPAIKNR